MPTNKLIEADNLSVLKSMPDESVQLIYVDPPFNTGRTQQRGQATTKRSDSGNRLIDVDAEKVVLLGVAL